MGTYSLHLLIIHITNYLLTSWGCADWRRETLEFNGYVHHNIIYYHHKSHFHRLSSRWSQPIALTHTPPLAPTPAPTCPLCASGWLIETQGVWYVKRQRCLSLAADNQGYSYHCQTVSRAQAIFLKLRTGLEVILTYPAAAERQHRVNWDYKLMYSQG